MYNCKGWQIDFWINGLFLTLAFSIILVLLQTKTRLPIFGISAVEISILPYRFEFSGDSSTEDKKHQLATSANNFDPEKMIPLYRLTQSK